MNHFSEIKLYIEKCDDIQCNHISNCGLECVLTKKSILYWNVCSKLVTKPYNWSINNDNCKQDCEIIKNKKKKHSKCEINDKTKVQIEKKNQLWFICRKFDKKQKHKNLVHHIKMGTVVGTCMPETEHQTTTNLTSTLAPIRRRRYGKFN